MCGKDCITSGTNVEVSDTCQSCTILKNTYKIKTHFEDDNLSNSFLIHQFLQ